MFHPKFMFGVERNKKKYLVMFYSEFCAFFWKKNAKAFIVVVIHIHEQKDI